MRKMMAVVALVAGCSSAQNTAIGPDPSVNDDGGVTQNQDPDNTNSTPPDTTPDTTPTPKPGAGTLLGSATCSKTVGSRLYAELSVPGKTPADLAGVVALVEYPQAFDGYTHTVNGVYIREGAVAIGCTSSSDYRSIAFYLP